MTEKSRSVEVINSDFFKLSDFDGWCFQDKNGWWSLGVDSTLNIGDGKQTNRISVSWCTGPIGAVIESEEILKLLERIGLRFG